MANKVEPVRAGEVKRGDTILLKGNPCKINNMTVHKSGKHGVAKVHFFGADIFTGKKYDDLSSSSHDVDKPVTTQEKYQVTYIDEDNYLHLMSETGDTRTDFQLPEGDDEEKDKLLDVFTGDKIVWVTILTTMDQEKISGVQVEK